MSSTLLKKRYLAEFKYSFQLFYITVKFCLKLEKFRKNTLHFILSLNKQKRFCKRYLRNSHVRILYSFWLHGNLSTQLLTTLKRWLSAYSLTTLTLCLHSCFLCKHDNGYVNTDGRFDCFSLTSIR